MKTQDKPEFTVVLVISNSVGTEKRTIEDPTFEDKVEYEDHILNYYNVRTDIWNIVTNAPYGGDLVEDLEIRKAVKLYRSAHTTHCLSYLAECGFAYEIDG